METYTGIDVSHHQGDIDWAQAARAVDLAMLRVGYRGSEQGSLVLDSKLERNIAGCEAYGLPWGVYVYSQAVSAAEAREEAEWACSYLKTWTYTNGWAAFDMEDFYSGRTQGMSKGQRTDAALAFCQRVRELGCQPLIYGSYGQLPTFFQLDRLAAVPIWVARYGRNDGGEPEDVAYLLPDVETWMWQYTSKGTVPGIRGYVDKNLVFVPPLARQEGLEPPALESAPEEGYPDPERNLSRGDQGADVKWLQEQLNQNGTDLAVDGIFGSATRRAVMAYQRENGLTADGIVGPKTLAVLLGEYPVPTRNLRLGSRGADVKWLQAQLNENGADLAVDGIFGRKTRAAVRQFQRREGLTVDGIVGPKTRAALLAG